MMRQRLVKIDLPPQFWSVFGKLFTKSIDDPARFALLFRFQVFDKGNVDDEFWIVWNVGFQHELPGT